MDTYDWRDRGYSHKEYFERERDIEEKIEKAWNVNIQSVNKYIQTGVFYLC